MLSHWPNAGHSEGENQLHRELDCDSDVTASESMKDSDVVNGADDFRCFPEFQGAQNIMYESRDDIFLV